MKRFSPAAMLAASLSLSLFAVATARALGTHAQERKDQLRAEAEAKRRKLGLGDRVKLFAAYPTPEVTFKGEPLLLAPGASGQLELSGTFPADATVLVESDSVAIVDAKLSRTSWQGKVSASKDALPGDISVSVVSPVSFAEADLAAIHVRGKFDLELTFDDGTRASLHAQEVQDREETCALEWRDKGSNKVTRTGSAKVAFDGSSVRVDVVPSPEELSAESTKVSASMGIFKDPEVQKKLDAVSQKMGACTKLPQEKMSDCMQAASAESAALQKELKAKVDLAQTKYEQDRPHGAFTCSSWTLEGDAKTLVGEARCPDETRRKLTGTANYRGPR